MCIYESRYYHSCLKEFETVQLYTKEKFWCLFCDLNSCCKCSEVSSEPYFMVSNSALLDLLLRRLSCEVKLGGRGSLIKSDVECKMCGTRS